MRRLMIVAILTFCGLSHVWAQYPDPFLSDEERPNGAADSNRFPTRACISIMGKLG